MQVPASVIRELNTDLLTSFASVYQGFVYPSETIEFASFADEILTEVLNDLVDVVAMSKQNIEPIVRNIFQTKKRWVQSELARKSKFHEEVEILAQGIYEQFKDEPDKCKQLYGFDTYPELKQSRIDEMHTWAVNSDLPLSSFRYLSGRPPYAIKAALRNDITHLILKTIYEKCPNGLNSAIVEMPHSLSKIPIDYTRRGQFKDTTVVERNEEKFFRDVYYIDDSTFLENLMNVEILKTGVINTVLKRLNATDIQVFLYVLSLRDEKFFYTREVVVDIGDVVRHIFVSDSQDNYDSVRASLFRMAFLYSGALDASKRGFSVKLFDNVSILPNDGREVARILVNTDIVTEYVKNQTIKLYKEIIQRFHHDSSRIAIFPLQRERIRCDSTTPSGEPLIFRTNFNFFRGILSMSNKKKVQNMKVIETMLDELIKNDIAVKSYQRKRDNFTIEFHPISAKERHELLDNSGLLLDSQFEQMTLYLP